MEFIDTHAHLDFKDEENISVEKILKEAKEKNVNKIITIGSDINSLKKAPKLANKYENVYFSMGLHPHEAKHYSNNIEEEIKNTKNKKLVAIGEIGLDYFYMHSSKKEQENAFISQLQIAISLNLPCVLHIREADFDAYSILKNFKDIRAVLHCYSSDKEKLKKYLDLDFFVSFTGIISFKKAENVREALKYAPKERIMLETDSPYLAPIPFRGKTNYPKYIAIIAENMAKIRKETLEEVANYTTNNAISFFKLNY
jgi:TatD DNase family protein